MAKDITPTGLASVEKTIRARGEKKKEKTLEIPTGADLLDILVGGGMGFGYPTGKIINLVGDKSAGKTFLACEMIAAARHKYKKRFRWEYDDCESGFSFNTKAMYGFEIMPLVHSERKKSKTVEELYCNIRSFLETIKDDELGIYVVDSLDGLTSDEGTTLADERFKAHQKGTKFDKGSYRMGKPKYLSQEFFPQLAELIEKKNVLLVVISQIRCNVDPMSFENYSRTGGKALDFYCHTVLWLAQVFKMKKKGRTVGVIVKARTTKSKTPRPYRETFFSLIFDYGLDNITSNIDFLFDFLTPRGMIGKDCRASWGEVGACSIEDLKGFLAEVKKEQWYRKHVHEKLKKSEVLEWLNAEGNERLLRKFESKFSIKMSRSELVEFIETHGLQAELTKRVVEKWEAIEASIRSNRQPKYQ